MENIPVDWIPYVAAVLAAMKLFDIIAKLTPTTSDDKIAEKIRKLIGILGTPVPDVVSQAPPRPTTTRSGAKK